LAPLNLIAKIAPKLIALGRAHLQQVVKVLEDYQGRTAMPLAPGAHRRLRHPLAARSGKQRARRPSKQRSGGTV
jgi:hypothetical protein